MIDLSFLTDEEQETILAVLKRDADLKKAEEKRIKNLQRAVKDKSLLKYKTGEWFYETKLLRHQDRIHGSDIIKASLRPRQKPLTILELSQILPEKPSFVASDNQDVYIPPELCGLIQDPCTEPRERGQSCSPYEIPQVTPKPVQSPAKQRWNPFNSERPPAHAPKGERGQVGLEPMEAEHAPSEDLCRHDHDELLSLQGSKLLSAQQESGHDDASIALRSTLKQRLMSSSKSLENLVSHTKEEKNKDGSSSSRGQLNLSVDDVSSSPTPSGLSHSGQMKNMSASVPAFQEGEVDSDSPSESNRGRRRNTCSSNMSLSSGMNSMSSVSGSVTSIYNADFGDIEVQGTIQLAVNYVQKLGEFQIFVVHCRDLAVADPKKNRSDPYVKCYLLPDKTKLGKRKTSVKKKTLNPSYNEILRFKILMEALKTQKLNISVWHNDTFGRNSFLGEVDLDLSDWDYDNTQINDYALKPRVSDQKSTPSGSFSQPMDNRGEMRIALRFLPQMSHSKRTSTTATGEVQIWVKDCKNLPPVRGVVIDPFVKCTVLPDTSKRSRQKTRVVKRTASPMFNHTMVYNGFRPEDLREACAEITVWDHDRLSNHYIGGLRLGLGTGKSYGAEVVWMDSTTPEAKLWERMMQSNGEWVEDILPLRMFVIAKSMSK